MEGGSISSKSMAGLWMTGRRTPKTPSKDFEPPTFPCVFLNVIIEETETYNRKGSRLSIHLKRIFMILLPLCLAYVVKSHWANITNLLNLSLADIGA